MRLFITFFLLGICFFSEALSGSEYPYLATLVSYETEVRSGPGIDFYATSLLHRGDQVEVYYETDQWCAIRPPKGSFSWVSASYIRINSGNLGTVIADGLASRVGSSVDHGLDLHCDTVQVKLRSGERVLILGQRETPENASSPIWYKISPPSGEYRWIPLSALYSEDDGFSRRESRRSGLSSSSVPVLPAPAPEGRIIQMNYQAETGSSPPGGHSPAGSAAAPVVAAPAASSPVHPPAALASRQSESAPVPATTGASAPIRTEIPLLVVQNGTNSTASPSGTIRPVEVPASAQVGQVRELPPLAEKLAMSRPELVQPKRANRAVDPFQSAFEELKEETRIVLTQPTEDWIFETLIQRGNELYEIAPTEQDLEKVYHLVETLQRTRAVREEISMRRSFRSGGLLTPSPSVQSQYATPSRRYSGNSGSVHTPLPSTVHQASVSPASATAMPTVQPIPLSNVPAPASSVSDTLRPSGRFDVSGKLGEFDPLPKGHPPYAVVDENEQIICLVSPASGIDLQPYIGKTIGINGILGIYERPGKPNSRHITAQVVGSLQ